MIDITSQESFNALCASLEHESYISIDTEFIREKTFFPNLALVQIAGTDSKPFLIDPLEIQDWTAFHNLLLNQDIVKIFHAGRQDIEIFFQQMGTIPKNIYDTQIAASYLGYGEQIGYGNLVFKALKQEIQKGDSYTNWLKRPLTDSQISYARNDVLFLGPVYEKFTEKAKSLQRTSWIQEEIEANYYDTLFVPDEKDLWRKIKKSTSLKRNQLAILQELAIWRYRVAREANKPLRFVTRDEVLISLSHRQQIDEHNISQIRGLPPHFRRQYGTELIAAFNRGHEMPREEWPRHGERNKSYPEHIEIIAELAWVLVKETAAKAEMAPTLFLSKKQMTRLVSKAISGEVTIDSLFTGWRQEILGTKLGMLLEGELALLVKNGRLGFHPFEEGSLKSE